MKEFLNSTYVLAVVQLKKPFNLFEVKGKNARSRFSNVKMVIKLSLIDRKTEVPSHEGAEELFYSHASSVSKEDDQSHTDHTLGGGHVINEAKEHKVLGISGICEILAKLRIFEKCKIIWKLRNNLENVKQLNKLNLIFKSGICEIIWKLRNYLEMRNTEGQPRFQNIQ